MGPNCDTVMDTARPPGVSSGHHTSARVQIPVVSVRPLRWEQKIDEMIVAGQTRSYVTARELGHREMRYMLGPGSEG